ncbi:hypothetical protein ACFPYI_01875 [Halomarina salina]|uniref:Uncharacterized protein n=1 Tax=Halomarina salina TaxID=1872699 RepID=A0ABD5RIQ6_9EURY|nr:hypothetical protein [Halomarina salina]
MSRRSTPRTSLDQFTPHEQKCFVEYFLHHCGYTYDPQGLVGRVTRQEKEKLFIGFSVYYELFEIEHSKQQGSEPKPGQAMTPEAETRIDDLMAQSNAA